MTVVLLICLTSRFPISLSGSVDVGIRHEPGVETRLLMTAAARYLPYPGVALLGQVTAAALDNSGLASCGLGLRLKPLCRIPAAIELDVVHEEWHDWQTGENRASGMLCAEPATGLQFGIGAAWRAPVSGNQWSSPFFWQSDRSEWNLAYRISWRFLNRRNWEADAFTANLDRYGMHSPQQVPFGIEATHRLRSRLSLYSRLATSIKGMSGPLVSFGDMDVRIGAAHAF